MLKITVILFLVVIGSMVLSVRTSHAQLKSKALDPHYYEPLEGIASQYDTIYGQANEQALGSNIYLIPSADTSTPNELFLYGVAPRNSHQSSYYDTVCSVTLSSSFSLHNLQYKQRNIHLLDRVIAGHFHSPHLIDLLTYDLVSSTGPIIYWSDENGNYNEERKTELWFTDFNFSNGLGPGSVDLLPYVDFFTSDSVNDVVVGWRFSKFLNDAHTLRTDSLILFLYKGGESLYTSGAVKGPDSIQTVCYVPVNLTQGPGTSLAADFRGVGHKDVLRVDPLGNVHHYKYEQPLNLVHMALELREDTLFSNWENQATYSTQPFGNNHPFVNYPAIAIRAFPRSANDRSIDLALPIVRNDSTSTSFYFYRGGSDFGKKHLYVDSPDFLLRQPRRIDKNNFSLAYQPDFYANVGDLDGRGYDYLLVSSMVGGTPSENFCFVYALGDSMDERADMFFGQDHFGPIVHAVGTDVNHDGLGDIIVAMPQFTSTPDAQKDWDYVGSIGIIYGSKKIPQHLNEITRNEPESESIKIYPNPASDHIFIQCSGFEAATGSVTLTDQLGRTVIQQVCAFNSRQETVPVRLPKLPYGNYYITVQCGSYRSPHIPVMIIP